MPRPLRICLPEVTYHCYSRCIEVRDILSPDYVKEMAIDAINQALDIYDFELIQLEFVENHFHIVIRTTKEGPTISRIMQYIKARITEKYNRAHGRTGTLWNEDSNAVLLNKVMTLLTIFSGFCGILHIILSGRELSVIPEKLNMVEYLLI